MSRTLRLLFKITLLLLSAATAAIWAIGLIGSLYTYRSPLTNTPPVPGRSLGKSETRRVVILLVDGLRYDTAADPVVMPFLNELKTKGAWMKMRSRPASYSEPAYTTLFTGAWPDINDGPALNLAYTDIPTWTQDNLFLAAKRSGLKTAISGYYWFEKLVPQEAVQNSFYTPGEDQNADRQVVDAALPWLENAQEQLALIHLDQVDYAGHHEGGPLDPRWNEAAERVDSLLQEITADLDFNQDTLVVASDHGHIDRGGHGGQEAIVLQEFWLLVGAGIRPGDYGEANMIDLAPTLAMLLGTNLPSASQGGPRLEMLDLPADKLAAIQQALPIQQAQLLNAYETAIGQAAAPLGGSDVVTSTQAALDQARQARLNAERLPRLLLGLVWLAASLGFYFWKFNADKIWMLLAALVYLLIFNLGYAAAGGRTYSLSSINSANDVIFIMGLALVSLFLSTGLFFWMRKLHLRSRFNAADATLSLMLVVVYALSLPVLFNFVYNGALTTWTLPEFTSNFLALLSLVQILFVSVAGLILTGISNLITPRNTQL